MLIPRRTITNENPLKKNEIKMFADSISIGETIPTIITVWSYAKSSSNPESRMVPAKVKVLKKYPHLVETDRGVFPWKEILIGYYNYNGPVVYDTNAEAAAKKAA